MTEERFKKGIVFLFFSLLVSSLLFLPALAKEDNFKLAVGEINLSSQGAESASITSDGGLMVYGSGENTIISGFPQYVANSVFITSPVLVDIDADGDKDIVVVARDINDLYSIYIYDSLGSVYYELDLGTEKIYYDPVKISSDSEFIESFALITESGKVYKYELSSGVLNSELIIDVGVTAGISASKTGDRLYITKLDLDAIEVYNLLDGNWQWEKEITMPESIIYPLTETNDGDLFAIGSSGQMHKISNDILVESVYFPVQFDKTPVDSPVIVDVLDMEQDGNPSDEEVVVLMSDGKREIVSLDGNKLKQDNTSQSFVNLGGDSVSGNNLYSNIKDGVIRTVNSTSDFVRSIYTRIKFVFTENEAETQNKYLDLKFDEVASSVEFIDISGLSNHAICKSDDSCPVSGLLGRVGNAIELDGVDDYLEVKHFSYYQPTNAVTIETWIKPEIVLGAETTSVVIVQKGGYRLIVTNPKYGVLSAIIITEDGIKHTLFANSVKMNEWSHVVLTYDNSQMKVYINGELKASKDVTGKMLLTPYPLTIGEINGHSHYKGAIDELKIYNRAINEQEIVENYQTVIDNIPYAFELKLDEEVSSVEFTDTSGNFLFATCESVTCPDSGIVGRVGQAIKLDGIDDYLSVANFSPLNISDAVTIETWIKPEIKVGEEKAPMYIVQKGGYRLIVTNPKYGVLGATIITEDNQKHNITAYGIYNDEWNHVVFSYDGQEMKLYINGEIKTTIELSGKILQTGHPMSIGQVNGHSHYKGAIDELKIYNRAITEEEVLDNYQVVVDNIPYALELKLDEAESATEFTDTSGNFQIATCDGDICPISGSVGRVGNAIELDGVNDHLTIANSLALNIADAVTLETWIKPEIKVGEEKLPMYIVQKGGYRLQVTNPKYGVLGATLIDVNGTKTNLSTYGLNMGAWNHVTITYDGTEAKLYVNGVLSQTKPLTGPLQTTGYPLTIGEINGNYHYKGMIDELKVYNRAITEQEVLDNYNLCRKEMIMS
ncbi:MAG: LamG domain-containing protein [Candidatus Magasanikbacteria bacterium]